MAEPWSLSITTALDNFLVDFCHRLLYLSGCDPEISTLAWFKFFCLTQWKRYLTCTLWLVQNLKSSSQRYWYLQCPLTSQRVVTQVTQVKQKVYEICSGFSSLQPFRWCVLYICGNTKFIFTLYHHYCATIMIYVRLDW